MLNTSPVLLKRATFLGIGNLPVCKSGMTWKKTSLGHKRALQAVFCGPRQT